MLRVDLRELARAGAVETRGEVKQDDSALEGIDIPLLREPVAVDGRLQSIGEGRFYWQGRLRTVVEGECRRCLTPVATPLNLEIGALFTQDPEAEDPDSYPVPPEVTEIDVTPAIREELVLAAPRYVLCRDDCKGLCPQCGKDRNASPCDCVPATDARWQPLKALKDKLRS
ncbi:MAG TPA: DUF177 domain-containing protein [Gemmatimonadales bacterium]|nr:DUF177 domain-containing protein [Gemmatimonadales bacterium]